jgi:flagellar protein FlaG
MSADLTRINAAPPPAVAAGPVAPPPPPGPSPVSAGGTTSAPAAQAASGPTPPTAVKLRPPEPAELDFDVEEMRRSLEEAVARLNDQMAQTRRNLNFRVDEVVDRTVVTVRNSTTGELVRQIPSESMLKLAHSIEDIKGLLLNQAA